MDDRAKQAVGLFVAAFESCGPGMPPGRQVTRELVEALGGEWEACMNNPHVGEVALYLIALTLRNTERAFYTPEQFKRFDELTKAACYGREWTREKARKELDAFNATVPVEARDAMMHRIRIRQALSDD